ncbi:efflux pump antibiotic resistance protein [Xylariaceae sp. FL1272]|nr:efflux pump antibiotic resistance protein [Xylariaceae sp. FL1272]
MVETNATISARKVPMEVLSLGFSRTGTSTMQTALRILGVPCYHAFELYDHVDHCADWNRALDAKFSGEGKAFTRVEWDSLLADYGAVTDVPAIAFSEDLIAAYPEAKVVLVERDIDKWYKSFDENVIKHLYDFASNLVANLDKWFLGPPVSVHHRWARGWMRAGTKTEMQQKAKEHYRKHYENVRKITPSSRLLEYELGTGWEPLCQFLGKPIPNVPFPRVNESQAMEAKIQGVVQQGMKSILINSTFYLAPAAAIGVAYWFYGSRSA